MTPTPADATAPLSVNVPLAPHHASVLADLAQEAGISLPAFCAFVLERYALHDRPPPDTPHPDLERLIATQLTHVTEHLGNLLHRNRREIAGLRAQVETLTRQTNSPGLPAENGRKARSLGS